MDLGLAPKLLRHATLEQANLPSNANWRRSWRWMAHALDHNPITVFDIGARGGELPELDGPSGGLRPFTRVVGFDADGEECRRLNAAPPPGWLSFAAHPMFIGGSSGPVDFHLYRRRGMSSVYEFEPRFKAVFTHKVEIERTVRLDAVTLDLFAQRHPDASPPDLIKLDTQGSELEILRGGPGVLARTLLVDTEAEFLPMYRGQPLFHELMGFMLERGFELLHLSRAYLSRAVVYDGPSRGQPAACDALFGRREDSLGGFDDRAIARYAVILTHYGHLDAARHVLNTRPAAAALLPGFERVFNGSRPGPLRTIARGARAQLDKLAYALLQSRRWNQLTHDSDRCYPVR
jgi:FkbM family methyltransferase